MILQFNYLRNKMLKEVPDIKKVVLAYSGGLDTSVILKSIRDNFQC